MTRRPPPSFPALAGIAVALAAAAPCAAATHSFEFVAEHLPEVAMDNRFASLPLWSGEAGAPSAARLTAQAALARTESATLRLQGPMASAAVQSGLGARSSLRAFAFLDRLAFSGGEDRRPLDTLAVTPPLPLPAEARFSGLHGTYRNAGLGIAVEFARGPSPAGGWRWIAGALYQSVTLRDYRADYEVLDGPAAGTKGFVDYSADYRFFTPVVGVSLQRNVGAWSVAPRLLLAVPLPRRGVQARVAGPGFDLSGDTAAAGNGKHFGDVAVTVGLDLVYEPWGLAVDLGSFVTQALIERLVHKGIDRNWLLSVSKRF